MSGKNTGGTSATGILGGVLTGSLLPGGLSTSSSAQSGATLDTALSQMFQGGGITINESNWQVIAILGFVVIALMLLWLKLA